MVDYARSSDNRVNEQGLAALEHLIVTGPDASSALATALAAILAKQSTLPGKGVPQVAITAGAAWGHTLTFAAGTYRYAHIRLKTADAFLAFTDSDSNPSQDGCSYPVNAPVKLDIATDVTHLHVKRDDVGSDATVTVTLFED